MSTLQQLPPPLFYSAAGILGLLVGSFLNVVILRLPRMLEATWRRECCEFLQVPAAEGGAGQPFNLLQPGSTCPHCARRLTVTENIPVLSYFLLRGRCRACHNRIALRYPLVELLCAALTLFVAIRFGPGPQAFFACLFTWALIVLTFIDIDRQLLPDNITLPLLWLGLLCNGFGLFTDLHSALIGAVAGYGILWLIYQLYRLMAGREGLGRGDMKLLAMLGAWCGWEALVPIIFLSSLTGALVGLYLVVRRRQPRAAPICFGPFLALAGWLNLVWGLDALDHFYSIAGKML
ncbi:MAG: A24 family peptidase [Gammaproteobacteria bacterium]|nr:A24 family peptidase [Gammaproteobacteria bacterium]MCY4209466.1 A24 family peptidase [Gammaproteobacteria bacterium]MCY4283336.1 A24 family peptidase [Gammaproteobacteria bacterium]MCY4338432.1 A24 family peptidase [Gammaproteobacteria bacterium]